MKTRQNGVTLIELIFALSIAFTLLTVVTSLYFFTHKNFRMQSELADEQTHLRHALEFIKSEIKLAGYVGCGLSPVNSIILNSGNLTVRHASLKHVLLTRSMENHSVLYTTRDFSIKSGDVLVISDCKNVEIFKVEAIFPEGNFFRIVSSKPLSMRYEASSEVALWEENTFLVKKTKRKDAAGKIISALYIKDLKNWETEYVEGIEKIQFKGISVEDGVLREYETLREQDKVSGILLRLGLAGAGFSKSVESYIYLWR